MEPNLLVAVSTIAGAVVGGLFTLLAGRRAHYVASLEKEIGRVQNELAKACDQVSAFYQLEQLYMQEVAQLTGENARTVQIGFRDRVEDEAGVRPQWTSGSARSRLDRSSAG